MIEFRQVSKNGRQGFSIALSQSGLDVAKLSYKDNVKLVYENGKITIIKYTEEELKKDLEDEKNE